MANNPNAAANLRPAKKGEVRNPKGRPPGIPNTKTRYRRLLELTEKVRNPVTGEMEEFSIIEQLDMQVIAKARKGDLSAYKEILDRLEGKSAMGLDITSDGKPLPVPLLQGVTAKKDKQDVPADNSSSEASSTSETD